MAAASEVTILSRIIATNEPALPRTVSRMILQWDFGPEDRQRMHELLEKGKAGRLTMQEKAEAESCERVGHLLSMLKAKARKSLHATPNGS